MTISLRRAVAAALLIVSGAVPTATDAFLSIPKSSISRGDQEAIDALEQKRDWDGVHKLAGERLRASDKDVAWLYLDGHALQKLDRCSEAIPRFRLVLLILTDSNNAQNELGRCLLTTGQLDAAKSTFMSLIGKSPSFWQAYYNLALVYVRNQDVRSARIYLEQLKSKNRKMAVELEENEINPLESRLEQEKIAEADLKREKKARIESKLLAREVDEAKAQAVTPIAAANARSLPPDPPLTAVPPKSLEEKIKELKRLYAKKIISKDVYSARLKELLMQQ